MSTASPESLPDRSYERGILAGIAFLILFLFTLGISFLPTPTKFQLTAFRVLLSLNAAWLGTAVVSLIPVPGIGYRRAAALVLKALVPLFLAAVTYAVDLPSLAHLTSLPGPEPQSAPIPSPRSGSGPGDCPTGLVWCPNEHRCTDSFDCTRCGCGQTR